ncbi:MAG: type II secretion system secretin GspD [Novosphingobium sp.]
MTRVSRWPLTLTPLVLAAVAALAVPVHAQAPIGGPANVTVNMRDVDIADVSQQVSRLTGRTIILDPAVKGTVNVTSATPLSPAGVWELFVSVLRGQGFAVVRNGRAWRVIPQANAAREPSSAPASGRVVTRTIRLRNLSPDAAARIFKPIVASFGSVEPIASPPAVIVTDYADNVARIAALARSLDGGGGGPGTATISLRYAAAKDVASAIEGALGEGDGASGGAGGVRAIADERSNIVVIRGTASAVAEARGIARTLDRPSGTAPVTRVFRLRNNDAEAVTTILRGLMGGEGAAAPNNPVARTLGRLSGMRGSRASGIRGINAGTGALATLTGAGDGAGASSSIGEAITGGSSGGVGGSASGFATPELAVQPAPELNAIVVRGAPAAVAAIAPLISELDVRRPQVMIEAAIVEITGDRAEQLGIQLGLGAAADGVTNSAGTSFSNLGLSLRQVLALVGSPAALTTAADGITGDFGSRGDFRILIQALGQSTRANLLSTPSITTLDNEPAEIVVGQNVPFRTGSYATDGNTTTPFTTIERADVGITLRVVPRVHEGDTIRLEVNQEVSSLVGAVAGAADIVTNRRSIQTTVLADDGQTIVLGGLISDDQTRVRSQVPVLGDIPVVGELFKSRRESKTRRTLFVFLKPTILRNSASVAAASAVKFDRVRNAEAGLRDEPSLLLEPPRARLPSEIDGIY